MTEQKKPRYAKKAPTRGGARKGGGRPKGSTTKIRIEDLMDNIEKIAGKTYGELLSINYVEAIRRNDWAGVRDYDKAFMNKMIADKTEVTTLDGENALQQKQAAFAQAIAQITGISNQS